jgi:hypothetical protein
MFWIQKWRTVGQMSLTSLDEIPDGILQSLTNLQNADRRFLEGIEKTYNQAH